MRAPEGRARPRWRRDQRFVEGYPLVAGKSRRAQTSQAIRVANRGGPRVTWWHPVSGENVLRANTTENENTAVGEAALRDNTEGHRNTVVGRFALRANTTGDINTDRNGVARRAAS